jgi:hypothetical protein
MSADDIFNSLLSIFKDFCEVNPATPKAMMDNDTQRKKTRAAVERLL